jgi:ribosomal protein L22
MMTSRLALFKVSLTLLLSAAFFTGGCTTRDLTAEAGEKKTKIGIVFDIGGKDDRSFNAAAYSKVGAAGLWQFMRSTGRRYMRVDDAVDERFDPYRSTEAAAQLLAYNYRVLGSWPLALTAYNHRAAGITTKVLDSALANDENNNGADVDGLRVSEILVDEGPTMKRIRLRAKGRADRILKRTSHVTVRVSDGQKGK